ncbi:hypothetical protein [Xenorhabdus bovienii]
MMQPPLELLTSLSENYWVLRKQIATTEQMILGLQEYVRTQCQ